MKPMSVWSGKVLRNHFTTLNQTTQFRTTFLWTCLIDGNQTLQCLVNAFFKTLSKRCAFATFWTICVEQSASKLYLRSIRYSILKDNLHQSRYLPPGSCVAISQWMTWTTTCWYGIFSLQVYLVIFDDNLLLTKLCVLIGILSTIPNIFSMSSIYSCLYINLIYMDSYAYRPLPYMEDYVELFVERVS